MAGPYQKFLRQKLDLSALHFFAPNDMPAYFCTPRGAKIIGRTGVDGIHFCFVRGFGEMVFSVSPLNAPGEYVHPVALDFLDFLRMLLACGGTPALEQAWQWSETKFHDFLWAQLPSAETLKTMDLLEGTFQILPMEQPYHYLKKLQTEFDYSRLRFTKDYCDPDMETAPPCSEWKVYFESGFHHHLGREKAGSELDIGREFTWHDQYFYIPALYLCSKGLVLDICSQIQNIDQLSSQLDDNNECFSDARSKMLRRLSDPFARDFIPEITANGKLLKPSTCFSTIWNPREDESVPSDVMSHYKLDPNFCWRICRLSFPWATQRKPELNSLLLNLSQTPLPIPGDPFTVKSSGDKVSFADPNTGRRYQLTVSSFERKDFTQDLPISANWSYPPYLWELSYKLEPEPEPNTLRLFDCSSSDSPRIKQEEVLFDQPQTTSKNSSIAIIGGADGPTSVILSPSNKGDSHTVFSAAHFEPADSIQWFPAFYKKDSEIFRVELL